jgi:integrase
MARNACNTVKTWNKTKVQGLLRHRTGLYYARLFVGDKEKWVSLKTKLLEVARARMRSDETVSEVRDTQDRQKEVRSGKMAVRDAVALYKQSLEQRVALGKIKPSTHAFWLTVLGSIGKTWPGLLECDVNRVTVAECRQWAARFAKENSPTYTNNTLHAMRKIFDQAIEAGALHRNPAAKLERARVKDTKLELPTREQFHQIVQHVRKSGHRTAKDAGDTIEFLAYSGCRIGEAKRVTWGDCDMGKGELQIKGDPKTGTKNWAIRRVPLIPALKALLVGMRSERATEAKTGLVLRVFDVRGSLSEACKGVKGPHLTHHDLRHLFATVGIESSVDVPTVSRWLGHKDGGALAMKIYGHLRDEHSRESAQKVDFAAK